MVESASVPRGEDSENVLRWKSVDEEHCKTAGSYELKFQTDYSYKQIISFCKQIILFHKIICLCVKYN